MMKYQKQEEQGGTFTSHVHNQFPMSNYEVSELTWGNGYPVMHGHGFGATVLPTPPVNYNTLESIVHQATKTHNTLESIVHQATKTHKNNLNNPNVVKLNVNNVSSSGRVKQNQSSAYLDVNPSCRYARKRPACSESSDHFVHKIFGKIQEECVDYSGCGSASATLSYDNDMTILTWPSFESPPSSKNMITNAAIDYHPSFCHAMKKVDEQESHKDEETTRSNSTRRSRAAAVHNQSERIRRHKINQKMKALQKMVPDASKTDKASMLDEVIEYIKQLQSQLEMMNFAKNMPHVMMMMQQQQQQLQMLAHMGMGMNMSSIASSNATHPQFIHPSSSSPFIQKQQPASLPNPNPFNNISYYAFLAHAQAQAQSMNNIEMYNKMSELYKTTSESNQPSK